MSKPWILIISIIVATTILGSVGGYFYWKNQQNPESPAIVSPDASTNIPTPTPKVAETKTSEYKDPAGFNFSYPADLQIASAADFKESSDYSKINLTNETSGEKMQIWMSDTKAKKLTDWLVTDKSAPAKAKLVGAINLDGISAEQYSDDENLYTFGLDQGVLYYIASPKQAPWDKTHELVTTSFKFQKEETAKAATQTETSAGANTVYEEEEVVE